MNSNIDEILAEEAIQEAAEKNGLIIEDMTLKGDYRDLVRCIPYVFNKNGTIKRAPGFKLNGGTEQMIRLVKHAERQRHFVEKGEQLVLNTDAGTLILMTELRDIIHELDLYVAIVTKGWSISTTDL
jgi:hypothetical protein